MDTSRRFVAHLLNRQGAFVRTISDEVDRCSPSSLRASALREQLREEETRLAKLLANPGGGRETALET